MTFNQFTLLDCTLRDGGYYNSWDFSVDIIEAYLSAMVSAQVDVVEIGFRLLNNKGFKGACAFTTDEFLNGLCIPSALKVAVMVNGGDLCAANGCKSVLERLFRQPAAASPVNMVRIACHSHEFQNVLPATAWLKERGYQVGVNLMQIADCSQIQIKELTAMASDWPLDVLYFADSMGSMIPDEISRVVNWLRQGWQGELGIHTHDNMGMALANTLRAQAEGVRWLDSTVTGMGRGSGNVRTEELVIEAELIRNRSANLIPLMNLVRDTFGPLKAKYGWGTNPFYYLAGKNGIHPTYIQEMINDARFDVEDILAVIDYLANQGGNKYSADSLNGARRFYNGKPRGSWRPSEIMDNRDVLILGTGPGADAHSSALEAYVRREEPIVLALNTQSAIDSSLINLRIACHPVRLLADAQSYSELPQPLITPASMLQKELLAELDRNNLLDFGLGIEPGKFQFHDTYCIAPTSLVLAYALAVVTCGKAANILMAGFDGYPPGDPRNTETATILTQFRDAVGVDKLVSVTPTCHKIRSCSIYSSDILDFTS
jgi:4-hydroxy 2-oxovalerate aldolase